MLQQPKETILIKNTKENTKEIMLRNSNQGEIIKSLLNNNTKEN